MLTDLVFVRTLLTSMKLGTEQNEKSLEPTTFSDPEISIDSDTPDVKLEPLHQDLYDSSYSCLMIPRIPSHELTGDMKTALPGWIQQVSASFNWQLEFIVIEPGYLQWGIKVSPNMSPGQFMSVFRKELSSIIVTSFPKFRSEIPDPDFWAPGYLVISGLRQHPQDLIKQFVHFARRQQGFGK